MDSIMPASVALNMPSTAAEVTVGRPHWPARGGGQSRVSGWGHPAPHQCHFGAPHPPRTLPSPGDAVPGPRLPQGEGVLAGPGCRGAAWHSQG